MYVGGIYISVHTCCGSSILLFYGIIYENIFSDCVEDNIWEKMSLKIKTPRRISINMILLGVILLKHES